MKQRQRRLLWLFIIPVIMIIAVIIYSVNEYTRSVPDTSRMQASFHVTAQDLIDDFVREERSATGKYAGNVVSVYGMVDKIQLNRSGYSVYLKASSPMSSVLCQFPEEASTDIKALKPGMLTTVKGICTGYLMDIILERCVVDK
jgi:hypothetical protein